MSIDLSFSAVEIADRLAIEHVIARYVHALDKRDYDALDDVFLPDARFDLTEAGAITGSWVEVKKFYSENLDAFVNYQHVFTNVLIEFDDDRVGAFSTSKVINPAGLKGPDGEVHHFEIVGAYEDKWRRVPDGWRISERIWRHGWIWGDYPLTRMPGDFD